MPEVAPFIAVPRDIAPRRPVTEWVKIFPRDLRALMTPPAKEAVHA